MMEGADITVGDFIVKHLIPVTVGNGIGGLHAEYTVLSSRFLVLPPWALSCTAWLSLRLEVGNM